MTEVILTTQDKVRYYIYVMSGVFMGLFGAEAIGRFIPSIPILVIIGMLFFPILEFIFSLVGLGKSSWEVDSKSLVFKYPYSLLLLGLCFTLVGWMLIAGGSPQKSKDLERAFVGGLMLYIAFLLLLSWARMRKPGISNE